MYITFADYLAEISNKL